LRWTSVDSIASMFFHRGAHSASEVEPDGAHQIHGVATLHDTGPDFVIEHQLFAPKIVDKVHVMSSAADLCEAATPEQAEKTLTGRLLCRPPTDYLRHDLH